MLASIQWRLVTIDIPICAVNFFHFSHYRAAKKFLQNYVYVFQPSFFVFYFLFFVFLFAIHGVKIRYCCRRRRGPDVIRWQITKTKSRFLSAQSKKKKKMKNAYHANTVIASNPSVISSAVIVCVVGSSETRAKSVKSKVIHFKWSFARY